MTLRLREGGDRQLKARVAIVMVDGSNRISKMVPVKYLLLVVLSQCLHPEKFLNRHFLLLFDLRFERRFVKFAGLDVVL